MSQASTVTVRWIPGRRLAFLLLLGVLAYPFGPAGLLFGLGYTALLALAAVYEARVLAGALPALARRVEPRLLVGVENQVVLRIQNQTGLNLRATVRDDFPDAFEPDPDAVEAPIALAPHARAELRYRVTPKERGRYHFGALHVRLEGLFALGAAIATLPAREAVRVFPNLRGPKRYELAARLGSLHSVGVRTVRRAGGGGEFEQLREYVSGDSLREIDWKATAKRNRPVTRVHGQEQSQTVLIALDAGRMMATKLDELTKLDHAIHAALLLAYVALRSGDRVGVVVFADDVLTFVPPNRGRNQYRRILEALATVEASPSYVDFRRLSAFVRARVPRRALLVVFSDLLDDSQALPLAEQAAALRAKHLPLCVTMNDPVADALAFAPATSAQDVYRRAAAAALLEDRDAIRVHLRKAGVGLIEAPAAELAVATVNRYLDIKSRHAL